MSKMRVVQVSQPKGPFEIVERETAEPAAGQVRVKVEAWLDFPEEELAFDADESDEGEISTFAPAQRNNFVHLRGDFQKQGATVVAHTPAFLPPLSARSE